MSSEPTTKQLAVKLILAVANYEKAEKKMSEISLRSLNSKDRKAHDQYGQWLARRAESRKVMYGVARQLWEKLK